MVAILSADALPGIRLTVEEYLQADLPEGQHYELVNGVVEITPVPAPPHDASLDALLEALYAYRRDHPDLVAHVGARAEVPVPGHATVRQPDLAVYQEWETAGQDQTAWKDVTPLWIAEIISPGQEKRDYQDKRRDYWLAGISEYWIIDRQVRRVTVLSRGDADWIETVFPEDREARSQALPGFTTPVARLVGSRT